MVCFALDYFDLFDLFLCLKNEKWIWNEEFDATHALRMRTSSTISVPRLRPILSPQRRFAAPYRADSRHPGRSSRHASSQRRNQTGWMMNDCANHGLQRKQSIINRKKENLLCRSFVLVYPVLADLFRLRLNSPITLSLSSSLKRKTIMQILNNNDPLEFTRVPSVV